MNTNIFSAAATSAVLVFGGAATAQDAERTEQPADTNAETAVTEWSQYGWNPAFTVTETPVHNKNGVHGYDLRIMEIEGVLASGRQVEMVCAESNFRADRRGGQGLSCDISVTDGSNGNAVEGPTGP